MGVTSIDKVRPFFLPREDIASMALTILVRRVTYFLSSDTSTLAVHKKVGEGACCEVFHATVQGEDAAIKTLRMGTALAAQEMKDMMSVRIRHSDRCVSPASFSKTG